MFVWGVNKAVSFVRFITGITSSPSLTPPAVTSVDTSRRGELQTQKLKSHLVRTQSLNVLLFKLRVGQYIAIHAMFTVRDFFHAYFYSSSPFTCIFSKTSPDFFPVLAAANTGSCVGPQNKTGHLLDAGSCVECPQNINRLKKYDLWYDDLWND